MSKLLTIENLKKYNSKINPRITDLEQVTDLGYLVNYLKQNVKTTYTVTLDGKEYTLEAKQEDASLPKLSEVEDYYGFSELQNEINILKVTEVKELEYGGKTYNVLCLKDGATLDSLNSFHEEELEYDGKTYKILCAGESD